MPKVTADSPLGQKLIRRGMLRPEDFKAAGINPQSFARAMNNALPIKNKYNAQPTPDSTGRVHPSKLQARVTERLRFGACTVIPEVSIPLSERKNDRIRIDCLVIDEMAADGIHFRGHFVEVKGFDLSAGIQKRRRFQDRYGIEIEVTKK